MNPIDEWRLILISRQHVLNKPGDRTIGQQHELFHQVIALLRDRALDIDWYAIIVEDDLGFRNFETQTSNIEARFSQFRSKIP